jgi:hemerythrin
VAEKLRQRIEKTEFKGIGTITVSIGVAEHQGAESSLEWFERVDAALYRAKFEGRNRVQVDRKGNSDHWEGDGSAPLVRLVWRDSYESGQPQIDAEHRMLFDLANQAFDASFGSDTAAGALPAVLDRLLVHIAHHFEHEEQILAERGYVRLAAHRMAHAALLARARELKAAVDRGEGALGSLVEFLANKVVAQHLIMADADFFPLFRDDAR